METGRSAGRHRRRGAVQVVIASLIVAGLAVTGSFAAAQPTRASWTDSATATSGAVGAATVAPVVVGDIGCSGGGLGADYVTLSWPGEGPNYNYRVRVWNNAGPGPDGTNATLQDTHVIGADGTVSVQIARRINLGISGVWAHTVWINTYLATNGTWVSTQAQRYIYENWVWNLQNPFGKPGIHCAQPGA